MKKTTQIFLLTAALLGVVALSAKVMAGDSAASGGTTPPAASGSDTNGVPDLLKTCPVSGDKLGGDMGEAYVFVYKGQQVKLCCSSCKKDFQKDPDKYLKLIRAADKK